MAFIFLKMSQNEESAKDRMRPLQEMSSDPYLRFGLKKQNEEKRKTRNICL